MKRRFMTCFALFLAVVTLFVTLPFQTNAATVLPSGNATLKFKGASLKLEADLTVYFTVHPDVFAEGNYTNPRVEYSIPDVKNNIVRTQTVTEYDFEPATGRMRFAFTGISPRMMKAPITAVLYGTFNGVEHSFTKTYAVATYCYNQLNKTANHSDTKFMTLLADLLNFGTAHQNFAGHETNNLINAEMTELHKSYASTGEIECSSIMSLTGTDNGASFRAVGITLQNAIVFRYYIRCDDLTNVNMKVEIDGNTYRIEAEDFEPISGYSDRYYVYFRNLQAKQMRDTVKSTICRGNSSISKTASYSIESYAYGTIDDNDVLGKLVKAMMYYGDSAAAYFAR